MRWEKARGIALLGMTALYFLPVLAGGGFAFDDAEYVRGNPLLADWEGLRRIWWPERVREGTYGVEQHYWPVLYTTYWLEHKLWQGFWGPGFHATNVALHCANAWLLWRLLEKLGVPGAWAVACVFALHPSQMEAVAAVVGRKDVLSTLCVLAALHVWTGGGGTAGWARVAGTAALGGIGVLCKTPAVLLLGYLVLVQWWRGEGWSTTLGMKLGAVALPMVGLGAWGWYVYESELGRRHLDAGLDWVEHLMLGPTTWWNHLYYSVVPDPAGLGWHFWALKGDSPGVWAASMGLAAVAALLWAWRERVPKGVFIAAVGFTVAVAPYLRVLDHQGLVGSFNNSRHRYVAALFPWLAIIGGWILWEARMKARAGAGARWAARGRRMGVVTGAALALTMHWDYGFAYTNDAAWYAHLVRTSTGSPRPVGWARDQQVAALLEAGRVDEALEKATERAARYPDAPRAKMMLGLALEAAGRVEEGRDVLLDLLERWNRPGERAQSIGHESFREIRDGGMGPGPMGMPERYMVVTALARMEQTVGCMERAEAFRREGAWLTPKEKEWTFRRADGTVYRIGGERGEDRGEDQ